MISRKMVSLVKGNSVIRQMFEEGKKMAEKYGAENVFDFSLGNPNVPAPEAVREAIIDIVKNGDPLQIHGYMSNAGYEEVRDTVAASLNRRFGTSFDRNNIIMTVGAASGLNVAFKTLLDPGDEVITFTPYFSEYRCYVANYDGVLVEISPNTVDFQPNLKEFEEKVTDKTKCVIINSPNNPTGVVYSEETIKSLSDILEKKQKEFGTSIYIVSDEPYRELVYGDIEVPYITKYYRNTIVGYSYSKSLSLPGERIGYLVIPTEIDCYSEIFAAATIATRILGCVNAPSLMQRVIARCIDEKTDVSYYDRNRTTLYKGLTEAGFTCNKPEGAFYLFMKTPTEDDREFVNKAKEYNILVVPGTSFGCSGYVRIAYCVAYETIVNSLPGFKKLANDYGLN